LVVVAGTVVAASLLPGSHIALGRRSTLLPGLRIAVVRVAALFGTGFNATGLVLATCATRQFVHELLHLTIHSIASTGTGSTTSVRTSAVAPVTASLAVRTITSHMACIATNTTNDVGSEVTLLRAVILAVSDLTTVLASLVLIVTESTVKGSELTELVALQFVLAFRDGGSRFNDIVHKLLSLVDLFFGIGHNQTVQIFFLVATVSGVRSALSFLDGTFASNGNLGAGFGFHLLQGVSTGSYE
jgi:hypothetical protein